MNFLMDALIAIVIDDMVYLDKLVKNIGPITLKSLDPGQSTTFDIDTGYTWTLLRMKYKEYQIDVSTKLQSTK